MRNTILVLAIMLGACADAGSKLDDCRVCTDPDSPECTGCLGSGGSTATRLVANATVDQVPVTESQLSFGIIGDTRPPAVDDTKAYPTAVITQIFQDLEAENPRPGFAVGTGDYQFSRTGSTQTSPQLDLYLQARSNFSNPEYPAMGNHECTGATVSNCGPGTTNGTTSIYNTFVSKILTPLGLHNPYYSLLVTPPDNSWSAKVVFIAANAWTTAQATWLDSVLSQATTYTFIVRHESSHANTAPGVTPSGQIIAQHPYTMLIVGHAHTYQRLSQKEVLVGNGGAPLTTGSVYGYGVVRRQSDGTVQFTFYNYTTHAVLDSFAVNADGSPATSMPPPAATFSLSASPSSVTSQGTSTISLAALTGFSGAATLAVSGVPSGANASFAASQLSANQSTTVTLSPGAATAGTYNVQVAGTDGSETETTTVTWTIGSGASSCAHDLCSSGGKLASSCDPCVAQICAQDSYCCTTSWSSVCVAEVSSICGKSTCGGSGSSCSHAICSTGSKLVGSCDTCAAQVCSKDAWCCSNSWDATCVAEVGTICGESCP
jgi:hypothetical protein